MLHTIGTKPQGEELRANPREAGARAAISAAAHRLLTNDERQAIVGELRTRRRPP